MHQLPVPVSNVADPSDAPIKSPLKTFLMSKNFLFLYVLVAFDDFSEVMLLLEIYYLTIVLVLVLHFSLLEDINTS